MRIDTKFKSILCGLHNGVANFRFALFHFRSQGNIILQRIDWIFNTNVAAFEIGTVKKRGQRNSVVEFGSRISKKDHGQNQKGDHVQQKANQPRRCDPQYSPEEPGQSRTLRESIEFVRDFRIDIDLAGSTCIESRGNRLQLNSAEEFIGRWRRLWKCAAFCFDFL